jgi:hypothetical protein
MGYRIKGPGEILVFGGNIGRGPVEEDPPDGPADRTRTAAENLPLFRNRDRVAVDVPVAPGAEDEDMSLQIARGIRRRLLPPPDEVDLQIREGELPGTELAPAACRELDPLLLDRGEGEAGRQGHRRVHSW